METIVEKQRKRVGYGDNLRESKNGFAQLLAVRLEDIVWREQMNRNMIHLYRIGNMWLAFDKSAYFMWQATHCEPMGLRLDIAPFSVIMVILRTNHCRCCIENLSSKKMRPIINRSLRLFHSACMKTGEDRIYRN